VAVTSTQSEQPLAWVAVQEIGVPTTVATPATLTLLLGRRRLLDDIYRTSVTEGV
jgi:hypothetical protein